MDVYLLSWIDYISIAAEEFYSECFIDLQEEFQGRSLERQSERVFAVEKLILGVLAINFLDKT